MLLAEQMLDSEMEISTNDIGIKLYDKTIENGNKWNIVIMNDNSNTIYGTGYTLLKKDTNIGEYGKLNKSWLINANTGEIIELEDNLYTNLAFGKGIGTTEGMIFNLDPSIIETATTKEEIETLLGNNVELKNINWDENSGATKKSFKLDGIDDYIEIKYDFANEVNKIAEEGITFEFYGIINPGKKYHGATGEEITQNNVPLVPLFSIMTNQYKGQRAASRFSIRDNVDNGNSVFEWTCPGDGFYSDFIPTPTSNGAAFSIPGFAKSIVNVPVHIAFSLNCKETETRDNGIYYSQSIYLDGKKVNFGGVSKEHWDFAIESFKNCNYFDIGVVSMGGVPNKFFSKMEVYSLRLYNRGLSSDKINNNYNTLVKYHSTL